MLISGNGKKVTQKRAWVGDGALSYLTRRFLLERYPCMNSMKSMDKRFKAMTCNQFLNKYARTSGLAVGCNTMEAYIAQVMERSVQEAYDLISDMYFQCNVIQQMDKNENLNTLLGARYCRWW